MWLMRWPEKRGWLKEDIGWPQTVGGRVAKPYPTFISICWEAVSYQGLWVRRVSAGMGAAWPLRTSFFKRYKGIIAWFA
jgi:hypothetical protein